MDMMIFNPSIYEIEQYQAQDLKRPDYLAETEGLFAHINAIQIESRLFTSSKEIKDTYYMYDNDIKEAFTFDGEQVERYLHVNPSSMDRIDKLLEDFDFITFDDGTVVYSGSYFEKVVKPMLSKEELASCETISTEDIKDMIINGPQSKFEDEQAKDLYGSKEVDEIVKSEKYEKDFKDWADDMDM